MLFSVDFNLNRQINMSNKHKVVDYNQGKEKIIWKNVQLKRWILSLLLVLGLILTNFSSMVARAEGDPEKDKSDLLKDKTVVKLYQLDGKELTIVDELEGKNYFRGMTKAGQFIPSLSAGN